MSVLHGIGPGAVPAFALRHGINIAREASNDVIV
jgi:hypothetical protein